MKDIINHIPDDQNYYLTIDVDGIDPSIMPAEAGPAPGSINYSQMRQLIKGLISKRRVIRIDIFKAPQHKILTALLR